jgi:WD40 repeat protein
VTSFGPRGGSHLAVGTSDARVLIFAFRGGRLEPAGEVTGAAAQTLAVAELDGPVTRDALSGADAIAPDDACARWVATAGDDGSVSVIEVDTAGAQVSAKSLVRVAGSRDEPCTSVRLSRAGFAIAGYDAGKVRIVSVAAGGVIAEICAHARCVTALDLSPREDLFCSAGEDAILNVYRLRDSADEPVEVVMSAPVPDRLLHGAAFFSNGSLAAAPYDYEALTVFDA